MIGVVLAALLLLLLGGCSGLPGTSSKMSEEVGPAEEGTQQELPPDSEPPLQEDPPAPATPTPSPPVSIGPRPVGNPSPPAGKRWVYVWGDEFNGTELDRTKWGYPPDSWNRRQRDHGDCKVNWGRLRANVSVRGGNLVLENTVGTLRPSDTGDIRLEAAGIWSRGKFEPTYGYFEARIKTAPAEYAARSAFWLQSYGHGQRLPGATDGAEIDIVETPYVRDVYTMTVHFDQYTERVGKQAALPNLHDGFRVFAVHWHEHGYEFYGDGALKWRYSNAGVAPENDAVSDVPEFIYLTTGISWGPAGSTACHGGYPNEGLVDYVRVWQAE